MRITENKLRRIIRSVIKESWGQETLDDRISSRYGDMGSDYGNDDMNDLVFMDQDSHEYQNKMEGLLK